MFQGLPRTGFAGFRESSVRSMPTPPPIPLPRCSVIVPFWNAGRYVRRCIESLLSQSLPQSEYELLFIDNNSTDGSDQVVAAFPAVRLLREAKQGSYAARNRGLAEARGEILVFTDPDCAVDSVGWNEFRKP